MTLYSQAHLVSTNMTLINCFIYDVWHYMCTVMFKRPFPTYNNNLGGAGVRVRGLGRRAAHVAHGYRGGVVCRRFVGRTVFPWVVASRSRTPAKLPHELRVDSMAYIGRNITWRHFLRFDPAGLEASFTF